MNAPPKNPAMRQGQFLWMDDHSRKKYLSSLKEKIDEGYYFSDKVMGRIVDEIAPVLGEIVENKS